MGKNAKELLEGLLAKNTLVLNGKVDGEMVEYVGASIAELTIRDCPPITINIRSGGGDVTAGLDIYDMLSVYPGIIKGFITSYARSMASIILQACSRRYAYRHARILIHHISRNEIGLDTIRSQSAVEKMLAEMEARQNYLYQIISQRSGKPLEQVNEVCKRDSDMTAQEALDFGLIDEIVSIRADIVKVK
jgi:ATP-dependent Clp protease protease subunit